MNKSKAVQSEFAQSSVSRTPHLRRIIIMIEENVHRDENESKKNSQDLLQHTSAKTTHKRDEWGSRYEFLLSCIGMSVGIGNIWRFPYLAYKNGGAVFLIPYTILLLLVGKPIYFLEVALGQFSSQSAMAMWRCCPIAQGVGFAMQIINFEACIYYHVLVAYTIFYLSASIAPQLPWKECFEWWDPDNTTCFARKNDSLPACSDLRVNITPGVICDNYTRQTASEQYWNRYVLHIHEADGIDDVGGIRWDLTLCLLLAWIVVYLCLFKGIKSSGKVVYFTVSFPYLMLLVLVIRGVTLEGASVGLRYLFIPDWSKLADIKVWKDAAEQMFYSLGISWGVLVMLGSYNRFNHKVHIDSFIITFADFGTSIIGCVAVFSILGHLSQQLNLDIEKVATMGPGLAFVVYPEGLTLLPLSQLWSVLFFAMLFTLGLDSQFAQVESLLSNIYDYWPKTQKIKPLVALIACLILFLFGLSCVTSGGQYVLHLLDSYGPSHSVLCIAICEMISLMWIYGVKQVISDLEFMLKIKLGTFWFISWAVICPIVLLAIYILSFVYYTPLTYGRDYHYPDWALRAGWMLEFFSVIQIPIWAVAKLYTYWKKGDILDAFRPTSSWGPADLKIRQEWLGTKELTGVDNPAISLDTFTQTTTQF